MEVDAPEAAGCVESEASCADGVALGDWSSELLAGWVFCAMMALARCAWEGDEMRKYDAGALPAGDEVQEGRQVEVRLQNGEDSDP